MWIFLLSRVMFGYTANFFTRYLVDFPYSRVGSVVFLFLIAGTGFAGAAMVSALHKVGLGYPNEFGLMGAI